MKIDIIIPVYNESLYIEAFLNDLLREKTSLNSIRKIIIVDDGSKDSTKDIIKNFKDNKIVLISYSVNQGKGYAMRIGLERAKKFQADGVIFIDGDGQHNPKHLAKLIKSLENNSLIFGFRKLTKNTPYFRRLGNIIIKYLFRTFFNIKRHDLLCGFMAIRSELFSKIVWESNDYGVEVEISAIVAKKRISFKEILIDTLYLDAKKGVSLIKAFFIFLKIPYWYFKYNENNQ
ncbi:hypothetical protein COY13_02070 [Candidatus Roizmanbacteria bacterium CG_4_10_14_0_2_um_filter_36_35]|uniref:Glycosyltransferase 2-like domain-containing protein n=3 Tax=Candidatus Roizmaniibacteriota TaxID=1752723 RepID=A0A2M7BVM2_9BACT|nr:MAG: hypothetical protein COS50_04510 [Candidatus Roizmanbacteria bacterium CG03_land_8_20_14_0_80_35_26]PIZ68000.1 MAG: hypothetical protein COY13_02070 [Candidatus Roizmanbacteria bacterium CG_4_10_14_0_2_um_filter_36_35]PJC32531.1 MAG: hypothetical protein CO049_02735 [Candidatus Roizmanbacteria bacterium CG_4_9_14_0_2_um_filter_36_12]